MRRNEAVRQLIAYVVSGSVPTVSWSDMIAAAGETLTIGILADRVLADRRDLHLSAAVRELLEDIRERASMRNEHIRRQFAELLGPLNAIGVEPIAMKGLAHLLRSSSSDCRLLSDIDILVPADRRRECAAAIDKLGYVSVDGAGDRSSLVYARSHDVGSVDLHTEVKPYYLGIDYGRLESLCTATATNSGTVLLPSPTCQLILLIVHDQLHDGDYWRGLVDVRHCIDLHDLAAGDVDWPRLSSFFPSGSACRALETALATARSFTGADVPDEYCGGHWAALQLQRRRLQARFPLMRPVFTMLTLAADPPKGSGPITEVEHRQSWRRRFVRRLAKYLRPTNPGKA